MQHPNVYVQTLWKSLFPIIKNIHPTVKYGGHCLRYGHTLVGKNYLLHFTLWKALLPITYSGREVYMYRGSGTGSQRRDMRDGIFPERPIQCQFNKKQPWALVLLSERWLTVQRWVLPAVGQHVHFPLSRCCFCHFDSITVIIMEDTAPDNYIFL